MARIILRDSTTIGDYEKPYIVAEVNTSHNGNIDTAKKMIERAKDVGCSCVKFQSWSKESLYSKTFYDANPIAKRIVKQFSFSEIQLMELAQYCKEKEIAFSSTPYSESEVDFLVEKCEAPYIKVASMDLVNYPFLRYIAKKSIPIVLSTGMGTIEEVRKAVKIIEDAGNDNLCLLHCISIYPPELSTINLNNIVGLRREFPKYPIGFSDHSIGIEMSIASVALGAAMIEKHLTLDRTKIGMDNQMATEPEEMARLVLSCGNVHVALGNSERAVLEAEIAQREKMRRSVIYTKNLSAGTTLTEYDLGSKRPGIGFPPEKINDLIGRVLVKEVIEDTMVLDSDFVE
jgi:sialic acid synthase SpsE